MFFLLFVGLISSRPHRYRRIHHHSPTYDNPEIDQNENLKRKTDVPYWGIGPVLPKPQQNLTKNGGFVKRVVSVESNSKPALENKVDVSQFVKRVETMNLESNKKEVEKIKKARSKFAPYIKRYESFNPEANRKSREELQPVQKAKFLKRSQQTIESNGIQSQEFVKHIQSF